MFVVKRDGRTQAVHFDKITERIARLCTGLRVDPVEVARRTIAGVYRGVRTTELDRLAASVAAQRSTHHPDYGLLAGRIEMSNLQKSLPGTFSERAELLHACTHPVTGARTPLLSLPAIAFVRRHAAALDAAIRDDRDMNTDYFGFRTLEKSYLLRIDGKVAERLQHMHMRVAVGKWCDASRGSMRAFLDEEGEEAEEAARLRFVLEAYDAASRGLGTHATPTLFNSGTPKPQLSSCFLLTMKEDSIEGIYDTLKQCACISKYAGGIGLSIHKIRASESYIAGTNGSSNGIIPMLKVFADTSRYADQCLTAESEVVVARESPDGYVVRNVPIADVRRGDVAVGVDGRPVVRKVLRTAYNGPVLRIAVESFDAPLRCTAGHPLLVDRRDERHFVPAGELRVGDVVYTGASPLPTRRITAISQEVYEGDVFDLELEPGTEAGAAADRAFARLAPEERGDALRDTALQPHDVEHSYLTAAGIFAHNGGGKRKGSFAIYVEPWHADIEDFLLLRQNHGKDERRARDLFLGLWVPDLFMRRLEEDGDWTLMCPNECPGLPDVWGDEFEELYTRYEREGRGRRTMRARDLWRRIEDANIETGAPYVLYKDAANRCSNQKHLGTIRSSNLCVEIVEYTAPDEVAVCNLASIALPSFVRDAGPAKGEEKACCPAAADKTEEKACCAEGGAEGGAGCGACYGERGACCASPAAPCRDLGAPCDADTCCTAGPLFDIEALQRTVRLYVRELERVIDANFYPIEEAERSNLRHRPMGIGVQGLADVFARLGMPYEGDAARALNKRIFEAMYFAALDESCRMAERAGPYASYEGSPASRGELQFDLWGVEPSDAHDWAGLRSRIARHGLRNSLLIALMPTASTAQILGNSEGAEPLKSNMYKRQVLSGEFPVVNRHLVRDLEARGLWDDDMRTLVFANRGSVQSIARIPEEIRAVYKTVWEIKQRAVIDMAADRGPFVCQSQSTNLYMTEPEGKLFAAQMYAWKRGLKTGLYYLRSKAAVEAISFTLDKGKLAEAERRSDAAGVAAGAPTPIFEISDLTRGSSASSGPPPVLFDAVRDGEDMCLSCGS